MIIRDRRIAELRLEDTFMASDSISTFVDYNDLRNLRKLHTFRFLYSKEIDHDLLDSWEYEIPEDISESEISYCFADVAYPIGMPYTMTNEFTKKTQELFKGIQRIFFHHVSDDVSENHIRVNLYFFSHKTEDDEEADKRIGHLLENYGKAHDEINLVTNDGRPDADRRLKHYTEAVSLLTVNFDSAGYIKALIDEAVDKMEDDIRKGGKISDMTFKKFVFYAGNIFIHLKGYYEEDELREHALRWAKVYRSQFRRSSHY